MQSEQLNVIVRTGTLKGERIIQVDGPLTMTSLMDFQNAVRAEKAPILILDLSLVSYIDSSGLGSVVNVHISCLKSGRNFAIVGVSDKIRTLFKIARLEHALAIFPTLHDAELSFSRPTGA